MKKPLARLSRTIGNCGTGWLRVIGRTCHSSPLRSFCQKEMILLLPSQRNPSSVPHLKISVSECPTVLNRIDQGESISKIAGDFNVSYEAIRRVIHAARKQQKTG